MCNTAGVQVLFVNMCNTAGVQVLFVNMCNTAGVQVFSEVRVVQSLVSV